MRHLLLERDGQATMLLTIGMSAEAELVHTGAFQQLPNSSISPSGSIDPLSQII